MTADRSRVRLNIALYAATVVCGCVALLLLYLHVSTSDNEVNGTDVVPGAGQDVGRGLVEAVPLAEEAEQERTAAQLEAASKMVTAFVNFDYQDPGRTVEAVKSMATGTFLSQYSKGAKDLEKLAIEAQSNMVAEVVWAGLVAGDEDTATAIVATSGTVKNKTTNFQPEARNYRIQLELVREDGRWLTKDLQYVALG
ncbi:hypothetical protein [Nocardioides daeguensis]|uniref:Mce-associated membrane protein n=1 Tax=Nocardioides daeguensis TaxID=908359 RepID=A0ABP6UUP4_9ACTN|nr:hypothetical protein [Nocardioides daeguensis]MBV6725507.1 hypothetical protein [Nocardioides daeguensis]MCR1771367.1 hypothetical protein [Nocardioides daeguensis]